MDRVHRVKIVSELFDLLNVYSFKRDQPIDEDTANFFEKVKHCCDLLELDYDAFKKEFGLMDSQDFSGK
ncbi:MAG: hypothetical protein H0Z34_00425 [Brevibacillus sp.]|nr:hypothetical protein [Brevibacillus sp.]